MGAETAPVYVIGHKNPDTDSICSAIAYAELKNQLHGGGYCAARAGQMNQETQYVLKFFETAAPIYVQDVMTDVRDIDIRETQEVSGQVSLKKAWNMMRTEVIGSLPITEKQKLQGLITMGDIANAYMDVYDNRSLSEARTPYKNILETLDAIMLCGDENALFETGEVLIATANTEILAECIHEGDMIILGNRYESQLCAIENHAACIVVCMGAKVSRTIQKLAQQNHCGIIVTPYDTFSVARMINQSMPISHFMRKDGLITFKVTEKTEDIKGIMSGKRYRNFPVLSVDGNYVGMISRRDLFNLRKKRVILVDHNEASQTVDGIHDADILEIIDHHRVALETPEPVYFTSRPLGCTATIIYQMYEEEGIEIPKNIAGILMAAIISETLLFRSPACTAVDKRAAERLAAACGVEIEEFAPEMFSAGSNMGNRTPKQVFNQNIKKFQAGDISYIVSQVNSMNVIELQEVKEKLVPYVTEKFESLNVPLCFIMLTNIANGSTELICFGDAARDAVESAFGIPKDASEVLLKGLVSRKKQLIPKLTEALLQ